MTQEAQLKPFQREERYIVIKRKHLPDDVEKYLRCVLIDEEIETVECVVVESDWPEYETVWQMIEARCTGKPNTRIESGVVAELVEAARMTVRLQPKLLRLKAAVEAAEASK